MSKLTSFMHRKAVVSGNILVVPSRNMATFHPFIPKFLIRNYSTTRDGNSVVAMKRTDLHFKRRKAQAYNGPWWHQNVMSNIPQCNIYSCLQLCARKHKKHIHHFLLPFEG